MVDNAASLLQDCFGNLGPGEGVKVTVTFSGVTSNSMSATGRADPLNLVVEFTNSNNVITRTVFKQQ